MCERERERGRKDRADTKIPIEKDKQRKTKQFKPAQQSKQNTYAHFVHIGHGGGGTDIVSTFVHDTRSLATNALKISNPTFLKRQAHNFFLRGFSRTFKEMLYTMLLNCKLRNKSCASRSDTCVHQQKTSIHIYFENTSTHTHTHTCLVMR